MTPSPRQHPPPHPHRAQLPIQVPQQPPALVPAAALDDADVEVAWAEVGRQGEQAGGPVRGEDRGVVPVRAGEEDGRAGVWGTGGGWRGGDEGGDGAAEGGEGEGVEEEEEGEEEEGGAEEAGAGRAAEGEAGEHWWGERVFRWGGLTMPWLECWAWGTSLSEMYVSECCV